MNLNLSIPLNWVESLRYTSSILNPSHSRRIEDLDFYVYRYKPYGKNFIKACQVSPDVYIQLALQLAYYK